MRVSGTTLSKVHVDLERWGFDAMVEDSSREAREEVSLIHSDELIDEAGEESFPASDPPATWSGEDPRDVNPNPVERRD
jgi:hypothetical protein